MVLLVIRHQVEHFARWKAIFDEQAGMRRAYGELAEHVFRDVADANDVLVCLQWDDIERARLFVRSDDLREAMVRAGVAERPDIWILKEVDRLSL